MKDELEEQLPVGSILVARNKKTKEVWAINFILKYENSGYIIARQFVFRGGLLTRNKLEYFPRNKIEEPLRQDPYDECFFEIFKGTK